MRKRIGDFTARNLIIAFVLLYSIMPVVQRFTSSYLTTYFYMGLTVILVILIMVMDGTKNLNIYFTFLMPFILYQLLTVLYPKDDILLWGYNILLFLLPLIIGFYLMDDNNRMIKSYERIIIIVFVITMITTIVGCIQYPNAPRILATIASSKDSNLILYEQHNIGGYYFIYYVVLLYPILILSYKLKRIRLLPTVAVSVLILVTIIYSEYTTALLLFIISSILFLTKKDLSVRGIIVISAVGIFTLLVFSNVITNFLDWLSKTVNSETMSDRLVALSGGTTGLEQSEDNRIELYRKSLNTFFSHPFFGTFFTRQRTDGGHSFILDSLAQFGLLGGVLLFFMYKNIFKRFFLPFKDQKGFGYVVWTFIQAIILSIVNTGMWLEVLCLFVPILLYAIYGLEDVKNEDTVDRQLAAGTA